MKVTSDWKPNQPVRTIRDVYKKRTAEFDKKRIDTRKKDGAAMAPNIKKIFKDYYKK